MKLIIVEDKSAQIKMFIQHCCDLYPEGIAVGLSSPSELYKKYSDAIVAENRQDLRIEAISIDSDNSNVLGFVIVRKPDFYGFDEIVVLVVENEEAFQKIVDLANLWKLQESEYLVLMDNNFNGDRVKSVKLTNIFHDDVGSGKTVVWCSTFDHERYSRSANSQHAIHAIEFKEDADIEIPKAISIWNERRKKQTEKWIDILQGGSFEHFETSWNEISNKQFFVEKNLGGDTVTCLELLIMRNNRNNSIAWQNHRKSQLSVKCFHLSAFKLTQWPCEGFCQLPCTPGFPFLMALFEFVDGLSAEQGQNPSPYNKAVLDLNDGFYSLTITLNKTRYKVGCSIPFDTDITSLKKSYEIACKEARNNINDHDPRKTGWRLFYLSKCRSYTLEKEKEKIRYDLTPFLAGYETRPPIFNVPHYSITLQWPARS